MTLFVYTATVYCIT